LTGWPCWIVLLTFIFCLRWPFLITLMYKLDRNVNVSHPLSLYQGEKTQIVSACQTFSSCGLSLLRSSDFCQFSQSFVFITRSNRPVLFSIYSVGSGAIFSLPPFFVGGWVRIEDVHQ
jgi:hypothetical protein